MSLFNNLAIYNKNGDLNIPSGLLIGLINTTNANLYGIGIKSTIRITENHCIIKKRKFDSLIMNIDNSIQEIKKQKIDINYSNLKVADLNLKIEESNNIIKNLNLENEKLKLKLKSKSKINKFICIEGQNCLNFVECKKFHCNENYDKNEIDKLLYTIGFSKIQEYFEDLK
jgi:hypothetical protein